MRASDGWDASSYRGVDGMPDWLLIVIGVLTVVGIVVGHVRRSK